jgi:NADH-quinone oxidoreductase subunit N
MTLTASMFLPILPEILLLLLAELVLVLDVSLPKAQRRNLGWVTAAGAGLIILISLAAMPGPGSSPEWGGMIRHDWMSFTFKMLFIFGAGITALFAMDYKRLVERGDFFALLLISTVGMAFMASAADLIMLYLAIETTSIPLYVLAGFFTDDKKSSEAGFKYLLFGAMTSAIMLYGFSLLYGFSGTTDLAMIAQSLTAEMSVPMIGSLLLVLVGFGFKVSAVPFHFWAPDVYEGSPTPVAGFLSTASKAAGFAVLVRFMLTVFPQMTEAWAPILASLAVATMTLGNLVALAQKNIKRLLAYSSIAHAGYVLIGVVAMASPDPEAAQLGVTSTIFYLVAYLVTNLAAFGIIAAFGRQAGSDDYTAYYGMSRRSPYLALAMMVAFLSLAGMPPFGGFVGKVFLFAAAIKANLIWLAVVGVLNSIVGLYYYLTILKYVFLYPSANPEEPLPINASNRLALIVLTVGIVVIGVIFGPWFGLAATAAAAIF